VTKPTGSLPPAPLEPDTDRGREVVEDLSTVFADVDERLAREAAEAAHAHPA